MPKHKLILGEDTEFEEAIKLLDQNGNGVLPVVDSNNEFIGLITDGDIRKAILNKHLDLEHIINKHPYKYDINSTKNERLQFLKSVKRRHLPLVDKDGSYVELFVMDDVEFNSKPNAVVIMAGGLGSRLGELTKNTPKPMLHVGKKPILESIIENFIEYGFHIFYIAVNFQSEKITEYFGDGKKWSVKIKYLHEDKRLGTAGGLSLIEETFHDPFLVTNGDVITTLDYDDILDFHIKNKAVATMCTREYEYTIPYGVVEVSQDKISDIKEKPCSQFNVNAGVYVLDPQVMSLIPEDTFFDMPTLFERLLENKQDIFAFNVRDYWIDVGHVNEFQQANEDINDLS
jgi:dTDP-glucose pyrophosphorylase